VNKKKKIFDKKTIKEKELKLKVLAHELLASYNTGTTSGLAVVTPHSSLVS
jgi:hypothetical protein